MTDRPIPLAVLPPFGSGDRPDVVRLRAELGRADRKSEIPARVGLRKAEGLPGGLSAPTVGQLQHELAPDLSAAVVEQLHCQRDPIPRRPQRNDQVGRGDVDRKRRRDLQLAEFVAVREIRLAAVNRCACSDRLPSERVVDRGRKRRRAARPMQVFGLPNPVAALMDRFAVKVPPRKSRLLRRRDGESGGEHGARTQRLARLRVPLDLPIPGALQRYPFGSNRNAAGVDQRNIHLEFLTGNDRPHGCLRGKGGARLCGSSGAAAARNRSPRAALTAF